MAPRSESRLNLIVGSAVISSFTLLVVLIFVVGQNRNSWRERVEIHADFAQVSGLKRGSTVQIEGMEIGMVERREIIEIEYPCAQDSEDRGRFGQGRTDDCDPTMFCAPDHKCAELELYTFYKDLHPPCENDTQCNQGEVCVTPDLRRRYRRVLWTGPTGICSAFTSTHSRIRVTMSIFADTLDRIRDDSRAAISQNGLLGDQIIQVSSGRGEAIKAGARMQTTPTLSETIEAVKERIDGSFVKVEEAIGSIAELASEMGNEETVANLQQRLANLNQNLADTAAGKGMLGALLNDEAMMQDFTSSMRGVRASADAVDRYVGKGRRSLTQLDADLQPAVDKGRKAMAGVTNAIRGAKNPESATYLARLIHDPDGRLVADVESTFDDINKLVAGIEKGDGTLGRLVRDPKVYDDLVGFFQGFQRDKVIQFLIRWANSREKPTPQP